MLNRLRIYLLLIVALAGFSALIGFSIAVVAPLTAADALEEAIRGADSPDEVRSRIAKYYSSTTVNRLLLCVGPGLAAAILAALALHELPKQRQDATKDPRAPQDGSAGRLGIPVQRDKPSR